MARIPRGRGKTVFRCQEALRKAPKALRVPRPTLSFPIWCSAGSATKSQLRTWCAGVLETSRSEEDSDIAVPAKKAQLPQTHGECLLVD